jgi:hypothetical protein
MTSKTSKTTPQRGTILTIGAEEAPNKVMEPSHDDTPCLVTRVQSGIPNWEAAEGLGLPLVGQERRASLSTPAREICRGRQNRAGVDSDREIDNLRPKSTTPTTTLPSDIPFPPGTSTIQNG